MRFLRLTRNKFHDRLLDARYLWAAAEFWRGAFPISGFLTTGSYQLSAEIWGFPRHEANALRAEIASAAHGCTIDSQDADPDHLVVRGPWTDLDQLVRTTPWQAPLASPSCHGLFVVVRMAVRAGPPDANAPSPGNSLALGGCAENGGLLLKACWHVDQSRIMERVLRGTAWEHEAAILRALDRFIQTFDRVPPQPVGSPGFAVALTDAQDAAWYVASGIGAEFLSRPNARLANAIARYIAEFPDDRSPGAFARRCLFPLALVLVALYLFSRTSLGRASFGPVFPLLAAIGAYLLGRVIYLKGKRVVAYHRAMNRGLARLYQQPVRVEKQSLDAAVASDPTCRKYTAELLAAGARHCYDFKLDTAAEYDAAQRLFLLPDGRTYVSLGIMSKAGKFQQFPGLVILHLATYFEDGTSFATVNSGAGFRKQRMPKSRGRVHRGIDNPSELIALHDTHVRRMVEKGYVIVQTDADRYPDLVIAGHEQAREFYRHNPIYSWGDALHEAFGVVRKQRD